MIEETVRNILLADAAITALVDDRIYPDQLPDAATFPAMVITKATGLGEYDLQGDTGVEECRLQIDHYAEGAGAVIALKTLTRRRLSGFKGGAESGNPCAIQSSFVINDAALPVTETERAGPRLRRRMLEFRILSTEV